MRLKILILFLVSSICLVINNGCASSSNSIRYGNSEKTSDDNRSSVRFSDQKNNNDLTALSQQNDTTETDIDTSDSDDIPPSSNKIDVSSLLKKYGNTSKTDLTPEQISERDKMLMEIIKYLDTPYKYGGNTKSGIDCSAFTKTVYQKSLSIDLERSAREQYHEGEPVSNIDNLQFGDLVFFNTRRGVKPGHVGIYLGDHLFAHASTKNGVTVSSLDETYYSKRYMGGRRIENTLEPGTASNNN